MLFSATPRKILAYREPVDMRKSFDGLIALTKSALGEDPLSGSLFVFFNRRRNYLKLVYWRLTHSPELAIGLGGRQGAA